MIKVKDVSFSYQAGTEIIKDITLHFDQRSTAIIGQNGAGKTTFVKLLKGLLKPSSGDIIIGDSSVNETTPATLAKQIGLVFQNPNDQIFKRSVLEEVLFGPLNIGQNPELAKENALNALKMVGLENRLEVNPQDLSLSDKKLLCIASIIAMDTNIIILDEPTIAQDHLGKQKIKEIIQSLKEKQKLVMTIIHDMDFVAENFERTIVFQQGKAILDGSTREVFAESDILAAARVEPPSITQLGYWLGYKQVFLTEKELIETIKTDSKIAL
ncbi:ATP-binding cassette domain-containing protein [Shimazuella sp. AN120528]|uniref:energy-coupling factor ABC transporter ATP-binding protein n=1 Tax=Shimazuella soli TaxID=1892854 RepID=UPI001F0DDF59|nr:ATP-binding cassette domain-containing protein [Shimazuella soli]MCH5586078.1 ATP-binding cassette domain-containing protein [Shimazuella soli]